VTDLGDHPAVGVVGDPEPVDRQLASARHERKPSSREPGTIRRPHR
jgi:hypothetical protein